MELVHCWKVTWSGLRNILKNWKKKIEKSNPAPIDSILHSESRKKIYSIESNLLAIYSGTHTEFENTGKKMTDVLWLKIETTKYMDKKGKEKLCLSFFFQWKKKRVRKSGMWTVESDTFKCTTVFLPPFFSHALV